MNLEFFLFLLTLFLSAFFSGSETAYVSANRLKLKLRRHEDISSFSLLKSDQKFLTATLVGNNVVMVACSSLAVVVFSPFIKESLLVLSTTGFLLIFGEILPKSVASQIPNRITRFSPAVLHVFYYLFFPLVWLAELLSQLLVNAAGMKARNVQEFFDRMDLPILMRELVKREDIDSHDERLVMRALHIAERRLQEIMVPRTAMHAVEVDSPVEEIVRQFREYGVSRLPVCRENYDHIEGFYHVLDFLRHPNQRPPLREIHFFPESMSAMNALQAFKKQRAQIAIVVDEHGGTAGLITTEDLVEEVVGSIKDEFDRDEKQAKIAGRAMLIVDGRMEISELHHKHGFVLPAGDYVTIAGLIEEELGEIPASGKKLKIDGYKITVLEADKTKIFKVRIMKKPNCKHSTTNKE